eukprot:516494_1
MNSYILISRMIMFTIANAQSFTLSNWTQTNALSTDFMYHMCGYDSNSNELMIFTEGKSLWSYHVQSDLVTTLPSLSVSLIGCNECYTQYNDDLYFIQNYKFGKFNVNTRQMTYPLSDLQLPVYGFRTCITASLDGAFIFIVGGSSASGSDAASKRSEVSIYDIVQNTLSNAPNMNSVRSSHTCIVVNDYLYAIGGDAGTKSSDSIERIYLGNIPNIASQTWSILASTISAGKNLIECVAINNYIYILGGRLTCCTPEYSPMVDRLDTDTLSVDQDTSLPTGVAGICAGIVDNRMYTVFERSVYWSSISLPTAAPTKDPSTIPSMFPTAVPSTNPTRKPTIIPSIHPTFYPSITPTFGPSQYPSQTPITPRKIPTLQAVERSKSPTDESRSTTVNDETTTPFKETLPDDLARAPGTINDTLAIIVAIIVSCVIISSTIGIIYLYRSLWSIHITNNGDREKSQIDIPQMNRELANNCQFGAVEIGKHLEMCTVGISLEKERNKTKDDPNAHGTTIGQATDIVKTCTRMNASAGTNENVTNAQPGATIDLELTKSDQEDGDASGSSGDELYADPHETNDGFKVTCEGTHIARCAACAKEGSGKTSGDDGYFYCMQCWNAYENEDEALYENPKMTTEGNKMTTGGNKMTTGGNKMTTGGNKNSTQK